MPGAHDNEYVALLDALAALGEHRDSLVVVGAERIVDARVDQAGQG